MRNARKVRSARSPGRRARKRLPHGKLNGKKTLTPAQLARKELRRAGRTVRSAERGSWAEHCEARERSRLAWAEMRAERGLLSSIARSLNIKPQAVHQWSMVPLERVLDVERITGIPREKLRPDFHLTRAR